MSNIIIWFKQPLILKIKMSSFCTLQYIITVLSIIIVFIFKFELIPVSELQVSIQVLIYAKSFHIETCRKLLHNEHRSQGLVTWSFSTFLKTSWMDTPKLHVRLNEVTSYLSRQQNKYSFWGSFEHEHKFTSTKYYRKLIVNS